MKFLKNFNDFTENYTFLQCPFEKEFIHSTNNGCSIIMNRDNTFYHMFKKIPITNNSDNEPISKIFENEFISYQIAPYYQESNMIRLITPVTSAYTHITSFFNNNNAILTFLQRHFYRYFCEILPKLNNYIPPLFVHQHQQQNINAAADILLQPIGDDGNRYRIRENNSADALETPYERYINAINLTSMYHMHPLCIFDLISNDHDVLVHLKPTQLSRSFNEFIIVMRAVFFEIIYTYSKSEECLREYKLNPRKLKVKNICHAEFFTSSRHIPPEFKCAATSPASCPHINDVLQSNGHVRLTPNTPLCHFLIKKLLQDYPDENKINSVLGFKCRFQDQDLATTPENRNVTKERLFAFYNIFSRVSNIHRLCIPDQYLSEDWLKWLITLPKI